MFTLLLACTIGSSGPATPESPSALEAERLQAIADDAGMLANKARELEELSRSSIDTEDPEAAHQRLDALMSEIETLRAALEAAQSDIEARVRTQAQSTDETRE